MNKVQESDSPSRIEVLDTRHIAQLQSLKVSGKTTLFNELSLIFRKEAPARMTHLREAIRAHDACEVAKLSHGFVGSLASLGARQMQALVKSLELAASANDWPAITVCLEQVEQAWKRLQRALEEHDRGAEA